MIHALHDVAVPRDPKGQWHRRDEDRDRDQHVAGAGLDLQLWVELRPIVSQRLRAFSMQGASGGAGLGGLHRAQVDVPDDARDGEGHGRERVEVVQQRSQEDAERIGHAQPFEQAEIVGAPGVERDQDADRRRGGVNDVRELFAGYLEPVEQRPRDGSGNEHRDV
jgi:hypothetical protein